MKIRLRIDQFLSLFFILLGFYIIKETYTFKAFVELNVPGPDVVPRAVGYCLIFGSGYVLIMSLLGKSPVPHKILPSPKITMILTGLIGIVYVISVPIAGFYASSFVFIILYRVLMLKLSSKLSWLSVPQVMLFSVLFISICFLIFDVIFQLPLPRGILL